MWWLLTIFHCPLVLGSPSLVTAGATGKTNGNAFLSAKDTHNTLATVLHQVQKPSPLPTNGTVNFQLLRDVALVDQTSDVVVEKPVALQEWTVVSLKPHNLWTTKHFVPSAHSFTRSTQSHSFWHRIRDDFNYKGFGISLYKSLLYLRGAGFSVMLPLLNHFDWWDSRPALPSLNLVMAFYLFPFRLSVCLSSSMPVEGLRIGVYKILLMMYEFVAVVLHHMLSGLWTMWSLLAYPWTQTWSGLPVSGGQEAAKTARQTRQEANAVFNANVMERVGCTYWWRWGPLVGMDTRISYWHLYMPRLAPVLEQLQRMLGGRDDTTASSATEWRRSSLMGSCIGLDTAVPNANPPNFFFTSVFSMSGLGCQRRGGQHKELSNMGASPSSSSTKAFKTTIRLQPLQKSTPKYVKRTKKAPKVARGGEEWRGAAANTTTISTINNRTP